MQKLTDTFRTECLCNNAKRTKLFGLFLKSSSPSEEEIKSLDLSSDDETNAFIIDLRNWLCRVLYQISFPIINEKTAKDLAWAHPMAFWLFDYADQVEACIFLMIHLYPDAKEFICSLKLLEIICRFRKFVLPEMTKANQEALTKDLVQLYPTIYRN
jgi:hypothetical protein